ncbi:HpcH/HpaI aldolase family protein [Phreatobacter stygius]|uniref:4-hydroxy-2-oxo-heptane-1,7-dioate aldolase n=1 Tax=Phreatobacter stygius TaxID=1940610 RepID=A0A4D7BA26_9HYPH|nr:aldolase/citrate lyase family protein [Phreatobacter stygius]QCI67008.1 4-hydroxy-2-oxo-heptane-1,7-dioate aldolase [Phreatobacter stygius]
MPDIHSTPKNPFRAALGQGRPLIGIWSMLNSVNATEGLGWSGYDWILIDGEHSPVSLHDAMDHSRALAATPAVPILRLVWNDPALLKQHLDAGLSTIMLPYVQSADEARAAVDAMMYPPKGQRGVAAMHRASRYGRFKDYVARANDEIFLIVQIETMAALEACEEIARVDGVSAVFFGPGDLAASMGKPGEAAHPEVTAAIERGLKRCRPTGKAVGVLAPNDEISERHIRSGFDFVSVANDCAILFRNADAGAVRFRAVAEAAGTGKA